MLVYIPKYSAADNGVVSAEHEGNVLYTCGLSIN